MRSVDMQNRPQHVSLITQKTHIQPNIFDQISSGTRVWAQKDCIELQDVSILSFTALLGEFSAGAATLSSFI